MTIINYSYKKKKKDKKLLTPRKYLSPFPRKECSPADLWVKVASSVSEDAIMEMLYVFVCMCLWDS